MIGFIITAIGILLITFGWPRLDEWRAKRKGERKAD
jgi:hypothetical protein